MSPVVRRGAPVVLALSLVSVLVSVLATGPSSAERPGDRPARPTPSARRGHPPVVVETFNILGSDHPGAGRAIGGDAKARARRASALIAGGHGVPAADIAGLQEVTPHQRHLFDADLPAYAAVPADDSDPGNTIYFRTSRFTLVDDGEFHYPYYADRGLTPGHGNGRWALLRETATGRLFYAVNLHAVSFNRAAGSDRGGGEKRRATAQAVERLLVAAREQHPDAVLIVTGDLNSTNNLRDDYPGGAHDGALTGHRDALPYCVLTQRPSLLQDSHDLHHGRSGHCPDRGHSTIRDNTIDWVFASPDVQVTLWRKVDTAASRKASDHDPVLARIVPSAD